MEPFHYRDGRLYCEGVSVAKLAEKYGTPLYIYSQGSILETLRTIQGAYAQVDPLVCYSVKANSNLGILRVLAEAGSGFDVVSAGELYRVIKAGGDPKKTVFAGVGKTDEEIVAGLEAGVLMFNVESEAELDAIARVAKSIGKVAPIALRVNPDVDPKTHRYISTGKKESKFGMDIERAYRVAETAVGNPSLSMIGIHMHIGSQITTAEPYANAVAKGVELIGRLRALGHAIAWYNMGGGYGIAYKGKEARPIAEFAAAISPGVQAAGCRLALEPGRGIAGNAGILVSRVVYTKQSGDKRFLIQDAAMNDLIRPALYESFHRIWPVTVKAGLPAPPEDYEASIDGTEPWDVVGPVCESGDFLAKDRNLPRLDCGDLIATFSAGAYGMVMASNYNTRPRAAEILVEGDTARLVRRRETYEDLLAPELDPDGKVPGAAGLSEIAG
ncbi:MAG: diaminopimelate decarboxylase [Planctomycetes bacterium SCN 63-9]|nr:MAG: diaminopimelate decarboxylase [Planctomycetes bacterium SCN 63-9]